MDILILLLEVVEVQISMEIVVHIFGIQGRFIRTLKLILRPFLTNSFYLDFGINIIYISSLPLDMDGLLVLVAILDKPRELCTLKTVHFAQQVLIIGDI